MNKPTYAINAYVKRGAKKQGWKIKYTLKLSKTTMHVTR